MTITSFNPVILTKKPEEAIALFEALGFERSHQKAVRQKMMIRLWLLQLFG